VHEVEEYPGRRIQPEGERTGQAAAAPSDGIPSRHVRVLPHRIDAQGGAVVERLVQVERAAQVRIGADGQVEARELAAARHLAGEVDGATGGAAGR
jgi:hypothetical protein